MKIKFLSILLFYLLLFQHPASAQNDSIFTERLILDFPLLEAPYLRYAAEMAYHKKNNLNAGTPAAPSFSDYLRAYESPSMAQVLAVTKNLHATSYYFNNRFWNKKIRPTNRRKQLLNRLAANATAAGIDLLLAYKLMAFSAVWNHEEFHRNGLTLQGIASFDDTYYRFTGGDIPSGSITQVTDEDLIYFKATDPQAFVRTFAAGIESQYQLVRTLQKDNFFLDTDYANVAMNILITKQAIDYVNQFRKKDYDRSIDTMNYYGQTIATRDFAGWDFTPWVYDLFRPEEPYSARGTHPSGIGIDRAVKRSELTREEDAYLAKMANLQYLNFISPFMIGIHRININHSTFNFALRHYLTSFGYNLNADFFIQRKGAAWLVGIHTFHSKYNVYPGLEIQEQFYKVKALKKEIPIHIRLMAWVQPANESFYATKGKPGGLLQVRAFYPISRQFSVYGEGEGKTNGWVAGNPFLKQKLSFRAGIYFDIRNDQP